MKTPDRPVGLYVHIPFCRSKCSYCDFYSLCADDGARAAYPASLLRAAGQWKDLPVDTVYFGGGNPLLLGADALCGLLDGLSALFRIASDAEISLEANPEDLTPAAAAALRAGGFNRVSVGVQSLDDSTLRLLGRRHTAREAITALQNAAAAGFFHLNADLMLGLPGQTPQAAAEDAARLCGLPIDHLSAYLLKIEPGTPFAARRDSLNLPDADTAADTYLAVCDAAQEAGLTQYEISNFAKDGGKCRHNLKYWHLREYLGLGPAAHSYLNGQRFYYPRSLADFLAAPAAVADGEGGTVQEYIEQQIRLTEGLDTALLAARYHTALPEKTLAELPRWQAAGLCFFENGILRLTPKGFLVSNELICRLLPD